MNCFQVYLTLEEILTLCTLVNEELKHPVSGSSLQKEILEEAKKNLGLAVPQSSPLGEPIEIDIEQLKEEMEKIPVQPFKVSPADCVTKSTPLPDPAKQIESLEAKLYDERGLLKEAREKVKILEESVKGFEAWQRREQKERVESYSVGDVVEFVQGQPDGIIDVKITEVIISRQNSVDYRLQWWSLRGELTEARVHSSAVRRIDTDFLPLPGSNQHL